MTTRKPTQDSFETPEKAVSNPKAEKSDTPHSSTTLFVRNIPFGVDKDSLQTFFVDFGPLQTCFLVSKREPGESTHAGYGFVQFALKEDACTAVKELSKKHGVRKLQGRRLKVEFALKKHLKDVQDRVAVKRNKPSEEQRVENDTSPFTIHVLIQGGILSEKALEIRLRRAAGKPISITQIAPNSYKICYSKEIEAERVVKRLHSKPFHLGKDHTSVYTLFCTIITAALKQHRIILRNLPFDTTLDTLAPFNAFGHIVDIALPRKPGTESFRGFAFIQYSTRVEAEQAIAQGNGMKIERRPVAVDWALSKKDFRERDNAGDA